MAVNGNDTLTLGLVRVFFIASANHSHSIVPGGLDVMS